MVLPGEPADPACISNASKPPWFLRAMVAAARGLAIHHARAAFW
jgi:hypothetical protein